MDKLEFITKVKKTHQDYGTILAGLTEAQMIQPHTCGEWTVKDVIAHVTWYEREMVGVLEQCALVGSKLWDLPLDQRNAAIYSENKEHPLPDVLTESRQIYQSMLNLLEGLTDEDLLDSSHFREMPPDWIPWQVIASNTFEHYPVHTADIRKAFGRQGG
jgi:uncharacterized protein (TIGR03083 family)